MAARVQVVFDCADPRGLAGFWAGALGYRAQEPPDGFASWDEALQAANVPEDERDAAFAIVDPDGTGPRVFFQRVPESKTVKNRLHLDVFVPRPADGEDGDELRRRIATEVERLTGMGATYVCEFDEYGDYWVTLRDPEGNEFDVA